RRLHPAHRQAAQRQRQVLFPPAAAASLPQGPAEARAEVGERRRPVDRGRSMTAPARRPLGLFEAIGIELEYMIVDAGTLDVLPICDRLLAAEAMRADSAAAASSASTASSAAGAAGPAVGAAGKVVSDVERGPISWSNELALHV